MRNAISHLELKDFLDQKVEYYQRFRFIEDDPILIPHRFRKKQDIEIAAFFAATLAWGRRKSIISKCSQLIELMDDAPFDFVVNHHPKDLLLLKNFVYRTFNFVDLSYFLTFLQSHYNKYPSLEVLFLPNNGDKTVEVGLINFHNSFISLPNFQNRTNKHVASPHKKSACKRLNMFLRWMVRTDSEVDFGIWNKISSDQLICPCDVHVARVSQKLNLMDKKQINWAWAEELTSKLKEFDPKDPVKYDFALFGLGVEEKF